jgi:hypothetical protein
MSIFSYIAYSKANNHNLEEVEGLIIYESYNAEQPFLVFFIPGKKKVGESEDTFINRCLTTNETSYIMFLDGLRWIHKNLADDIEKLRHDTIIHVPLSGMHKARKISHVVIGFKQLNPSDDDELISNGSSNYMLTFIYKGKSYTKPAEDIPDEMGVPSFLKH